MGTRFFIISVTFCTLLFTTYSAGADCIRSCTANLFVDLTYQPQGQESVQRKTPTLKTLEKETRDGRYGGGCGLTGIIKAKERGCTDAVQALMRRYHNRNQAQQDVVCHAVQVDSTLFDRAKAGFPAADWYAIDKMEAYGKRDSVARRGAIGTDRRPFRCEGGQAAELSSSQPQPPASPAPAPAPAPDPSPPPAPPTSSGPPDLIISRVELRSTGECREYRPVVIARVTLTNVGGAPVPEIRDNAVVSVMNEQLRWGNGKKISGIIPPGASKTVEISINYLIADPAAMRGTRTFKVTADPGHRIDERNENNNSVERSIDVGCN